MNIFAKGKDGEYPKEYYLIVKRIECKHSDYNLVGVKYPDFFKYNVTLRGNALRLEDGMKRVSQSISLIASAN